MSEAGTPDLAAALGEIRERMDAAARRAGRFADDITLIGASKTVPAERIAEALDAGLTDLGENRAQELLAKAPVLADRPVPPTLALRRSAAAQQGGVTRRRGSGAGTRSTAWRSGRRSPAARPGARVLVEVNLGEEPTKGGAAPDEVDALVDGAGRARPRR